MYKFINVQIDNKTGIEMYLLFKRNSLKNKYLRFLPTEEEFKFWKAQDIKRGKLPFMEEVTIWENYDKEKSNLKLLENDNNRFLFFIENGDSGTLYISPHPLGKEQPYYKTAVFLFDQINISYDAKDNTSSEFLGKWKLSNSEFFGLPIQLKSKANKEGKKENEKNKIGFEDYITRAKMIRYFSEMNAPFNAFKMPLFSENVNRWLSPASKNPGNIWKDAISYGLKELSVKGKNEFVYNNEKGEVIICQFKNGTDTSIEVREIYTDKNERIDRKFIFRNIDTFAAIRGTLFPDNIKTKVGRKYIDGDESNITIRSGAFIAAAINRGVLYDTTLWKYEAETILNPKKQNYYNSNDENKGQFNLYSKILHDHSIRHQCFGFCYDHFFEKGSILNIYKNALNEADVKVTLLPFK